MRCARASEPVSIGLAIDPAGVKSNKIVSNFASLLSSIPIRRVQCPYRSAPAHWKGNMEIGLSKRGDMHILAVKGKIRLQNWRVVDKHLETLLAKGGKCLVMDLSEVTLICSTGVGAILHHIQRFRKQNSRLVLYSTSPQVQEIFRVFGYGEEGCFPDWDSLTSKLKAEGVAVTP